MGQQIDSTLRTFFLSFWLYLPSRRTTLLKCRTWTEERARARMEVKKKGSLRTTPLKLLYVLGNHMHDIVFCYPERCLDLHWWVVKKKDEKN